MKRLVFAVLWWLVFVEQLYATNASYRVTELTGRVLARRANSIFWKEVRPGDKLYAGQLLQVTAYSVVTVQQQGLASKAGLEGDSAFVTIKAPMILRVGPQMLRDVKISSHFIHKLPEIAETFEQDPLSLFLDEAWEKTTAIFSSKSSNSNLVNLAELEKQGMNMSVTAKRLQILTPSSNSLIHFDKRPVEVQMTWTRAKDKNVEYHVYAWKTEEKKSAPIAITKDDFHTISLMDAGSYFVQVSSSDGKWQSPAKVLHIAPMEDLDDEAEDSGVIAHRDAKMKSKLELTTPPQDFTIYSREARQLITFSWQAAGLPADAKVELVIEAKGTKQKERRMPVTKESKLNAEMERGVYQWHLEISRPNATSKAIVRSESRNITFHKSSGLLSSSSSILDSASGTFYFADGL